LQCNLVAAFSAIVLSDEDIDSEVARLWSRWALFAETATRLHCNLVAAFSAIVLSDEDIDSEVAGLCSRWALFAETATRLHCNLVAAFSAIVLSDEDIEFRGRRTLESLGTVRRNRNQVAVQPGCSLLGDRLIG